MPLKAYRKATVFAAANTFHGSVLYPEQFAIKPIGIGYGTHEQVTMWSMLSSTYRSLKNLVATSSMAGLLIPTLFIASGVFVIYQQVQPTITHKIKESAGYYDQGTVALVQDSYIANRLQYVSNPGASYFESLTTAALNRHLLAADEKSATYSGKFYITIPSLGFERLPISANVESGSKEVYDQVLNTSLAHFKGTSLPFSEVNNNTVIYGHSAGGSYNPSPTDVLAAFSFLPNLKLGDLIILEVDGVEYKYRMTRSKIVEPSDTTIITGTPGKKTLTLFTCYPPGNDSQRYVAVAAPVT
jgi:LPXTG-site transpeptidase (sortase) family protein